MLPRKEAARYMRAAEQDAQTARLIYRLPILILGWCLGIFGALLFGRQSRTSTRPGSP